MFFHFAFTTTTCLVAIQRDSTGSGPQAVVLKYDDWVVFGIFNDSTKEITRFIVVV